MFWKHLRTDITATEGPVSIPRTLNTSVLYADDWKKFDKLQKAVKSQGWMGWIRIAVDASVAAGAVRSLRKEKLYTAGILVLVIAAEIIYHHVLKARFEHWKCPRCHSEWPGTNKEKDSACRICGLRLHQSA